jgi:hypothetical protein
MSTVELAANAPLPLKASVPAFTVVFPLYVAAAVNVKVPEPNVDKEPPLLVSAVANVTD